MSDILNVDLSQVIDTQAVKIGDHVYQVRRLGVGEELDLSENIKRVGDLLKNMGDIRKKIEKSKSEATKKKLMAEIDDISDTVDAMQRAHFEAYVRLFDDGGDGEKSRQMLARFNMEGISNLFEQVFPSRVAQQIEEVVSEVEEDERAES